MRRNWCIEQLFIPHLGSGDGYQFASGFIPGRCKGSHGHGDRWRWWVLFHTFFRHDSPRRFGTLDVELERTQ